MTRHRFLEADPPYGPVMPSASGEIDHVQPDCGSFLMYSGVPLSVQVSLECEDRTGGESTRALPRGGRNHRNIAAGCDRLLF